MKIRAWINDGALRSVLVAWDDDGAPSVSWWSLGGSDEEKALFMADESDHEGPSVIQVIGQCAGQRGRSDAGWMREAIAARAPIVVRVPSGRPPESLREAARTLGWCDGMRDLLAVVSAARDWIDERTQAPTTVVAVRPESCRGPGWSNQIVWIYERQSDGTITERGLQPDEWRGMPGLGDLFAVGEACQVAMIGPVSKSLRCAEPQARSSAPTWTLHRLYSVARTRSETSEERYGQALFNTLVQVRPDIAERLRGSDADPFYANGGDERANRAIAVIESMWGDRPC